MRRCSLHHWLARKLGAVPSGAGRRTGGQSWWSVLAGPAIALVIGSFASSCAAETRVDLLQECELPGTPCGEGLVCSDQRRCVPQDASSIDGGLPTYDGGVVDLPDGGVPALIDGACATWESRSEPLPASLMLVVDVSRSMLESASGGGSRWTVTQDALRVTMAELPPTTEVGMLLFPNQRTEAGLEPRPVTECVDVEDMVPIAPLGSDRSEQRFALEEALRYANVGEGTPTHDAYLVAREELERRAPFENRYLLLITDGQPNLSLGCMGWLSGRSFVPVSEGPIIDEIHEARHAGISTFIIGAPGSEQTDEEGEDARTWLSRAASAGGTAKELCSHAGPTFCHFDMVDEPDFSAALGAALAQITGQILPCDYPLPQPGHDQYIDPAAVNVVWSPGDEAQKLFLRNDSEDCLEGWHYIDGGSRIELCPQSCERVRSHRGSEVTLIFGCETEVLLY